MNIISFSVSMNSDFQSYLSSCSAPWILATGLSSKSRAEKVPLMDTSSIILVCNEAPHQWRRTATDFSFMTGTRQFSYLCSNHLSRRAWKKSGLHTCVKSSGCPFQWRYTTRMTKASITWFSLCLWKRAHDWLCQMAQTGSRRLLTVKWSILLSTGLHLSRHHSSWNLSSNCL